MPLFMDLHKAADYDTRPTVEEIKKNHIADLAVQHKYGVRFIQYWINEEAGMVFCLMEAHDKEACSAVHAEAHGAMPCNIIELKGGDYSAFLNDTRKNEFDIVEQSDGSLDTGFRAIMVVQLLSFSNANEPGEEIHKKFSKHGGHLLPQPGLRDVAVFTTTAIAFACARDIIQTVKASDSRSVEVKIGISAGAPVTDGQHLFADAIELANQLSDLAPPGKALISLTAWQLSAGNSLHPPNDEFINVLNKESEQFVAEFLKATASLAPGNQPDIDGLTKALGTSRSQLYRKVKAVTGLSPNSFMQERRLQKAVQLMNEQYGNITQVALEAGFNNLSYFAKSFQQRFGMPPMKAAKLHAS